ncbi:MAG TPA: hypothetical protein VN419_00345 [Humidesulfovibrio sp.]|uniref:hypothetical protein n=1 Tax=Humidesulfovibrio sp. TaxID=2910988 RepID=UPI002C3F462B|nr:hypothetical protein [Humidesulfovibrio sp.]HWR02436.1 hypothetical protein [Humidesulfovibrio sp.]
MPKQPSGELAVTGDDCPATGIWAVADHPESVATMVKGNIMPPYEGKSVTWRYLDSAAGKTRAD